jgi:DNA polymerase III delta prime subunit
MNQLFTEKYRPKTLDDLIVPERVMNQFKNGVQTNLLFYGTPGTGKTSAAKALCNHFGHDMMYINASLDGRIDVIKSKIESFAHAFSLIPNDRNNGEKRFKVVILDECLEENEKVRIGTVDNWKAVPLKDLDKDIEYNCPSMNIETGELENDTCKIISEKVDALYEVEVEDGRTIKVTSNHPFMIKTKSGQIIEKTIDNGLSTDDEIISF